MSIPTRPHLGCDPMCSDCDASLDSFQEAVRPAVERGLEAFWKEIRRAYPALTWGRKVPSYVSMEVEDMQIRGEEAVTYWLFEVVNKDRPRYKPPRRKRRNKALEERIELDHVASGKTERGEGDGREA